MASKPKKSEQELSAQSNEDRREFLDPVTTMTLWSVFWFVLKSALQSIIGWLALQVFMPIGSWMKKMRKGKHDEQLDQGVLEKDEEQEA